ncbi:hypothetical protein OKW40_006129 [Paraburkholderia sp. RAU6.4a]|uniref:hypothetical protein n=1 Tax=unclassified Paraburkholderia TaxID=2615204 RepID=UPI003D2005B3
MPVDFDALPARGAIPDGRQAVVPWLIAVVIIVAAGAATSIATWPAGRPTQTPWFWIRMFGLPLLVWLGLYFGWGFLGAHRLRNALADNAAIDRKEARLHGDASVPFAVMAQSWRFSGDAGQNRLEDAMKTRESTENPAGSGGLVIPGRAFFRGNEADELRRHAVVLEWLLVELIRPLMAPLKAAHGLTVWLCLDSDLTADVAKTVITRAWATLGLRYAEKVQLLEPMSLYSLDAWFDMGARNARHLAIAVQLRGAISGGIQAGQAEAGAAVLLTGTSAESPDSGVPVRVHRPSRGTAGSLDEVVANALRWGHCAEGGIDTVWNPGLVEPLAAALRSLDGSVNEAPAVELVRTIGDAGVATPWLALALAAANAQESVSPQLILDQQGGELVAMICRKKT